MSDEKVWDRLERPPVEERIKKAREIREKMGIYGPGGQVTSDFYEISPIHTQTMFEWCFGMVWAQPDLDLKTKEIVVLTTMAAQDQPSEFEWHVRSALNLGITRAEIIAVIVQCMPYIGLPKANHAFMAAKRAFAIVDGEKAA